MLSYKTTQASRDAANKRADEIMRAKGHGPDSVVSKPATDLAAKGAELLASRNRG